MPLPSSVRPVRTLAAWATIIALAGAQEKPPVPPGPEEAETLALGKKELDAYATLCFKNGFPKRAREVWLEVIGEYDTDDEVARKAVGFYRHGAVWQRDPKFEYPEHETPNAGVANMLEAKWKALAQKLGDAHRGLAEKLQVTGKAERATYHTQRALRFLPQDQKAAASAGLTQFEGISGTPVDLGILRRSRLMDRAVTRLTEQAFPAKVVDQKHAVMDRGQVPYLAVKSENFNIYGDYDEGVLQDAAAWAERSLAFCKEAFADQEDFVGRGVTKNMAFFRERATWVKVVEANRGNIGRDVDFIVKNASATTIQDLKCAGPDGPEVVFDLAVRWVVQDYAGLHTDAMNEGIGHAVVAMFFGRNLVFSVGQQKHEGTVAGKREEQKLLLPDLDTWREIATEIAWSKSETPAAKLPLLKAAQFPTDGRIKAWSFCDYLLRRDPMLLRRLDATAAKARHEGDVTAAFREAAQLGLDEVEAGWRRFWTEDSALKKAILQKSTPLEATAKEAPAWLDAWNALRQRYGTSPVGWSAQYSTDCKQHVDYLKANKDQRGPEAEHTQVPGKPQFQNEGRSFAQTALVWLGKDPKKAMESWMLLPGYRDAILNKNVDTVGVYADGGIVAFDVVRGRSGASQLTSAIYPEANLAGGRAKDPVPSAVDVELLGPEVKRLLRANKREKQKQIGLPLTLHLYGGGGDGVTCTVTSQGAPVAGWLVRGNGAIRRTSAPGLWVFYPAEPLKKGVDIKASWTWPSGSHEVTFTAN